MVGWIANATSTIRLNIIVILFILFFLIFKSIDVYSLSCFNILTSLKFKDDLNRTWNRNEMTKRFSSVIDRV